MKNYKVVIEMNEETIIFETANKEAKINKIVKAYAPENPKAIKIYALDKESNQYFLTKNLIKRPEPKPMRPIGFGRW